MTGRSDPTLARIAERIPTPEQAYERILLRRDRKHRSQRITAGLVGFAVFVAAVWIVTHGGWFERSEGPSPAETGPTVNEPTDLGTTYTLGPVSPKDIAVGESFMDAWADGDGEAAAALFDPTGTFDGFEPVILPALHDWFRAEGYTFGDTGCGIHGYGPRRGVVGCGLVYENDLTRALGLPPLDTGLSFNVGSGEIEAAWFGSGGEGPSKSFAGYRGRGDVFGPIWDMFVDWISSQHPEDLARMYDAGHDYPRLEPPSIDLWERYTSEFVASPQARALARSFREAGWDGFGFPPEGTAPSMPTEGELVAGYDAPLGSNFAFVYADGRVISQGGIGDANGSIRQQRLTPEGVELVRSGAVRPEDFLFSSDPVPASAWKNSGVEPFAPARYAICFYQESGDANPGTVNHGYEYPSRVLSFFPATAEDILRGKEHTFDQDNQSEGPIECSEVSTDEARELDATLRGLQVEDAEGDPIYVEIHTLLPHGEWSGMGG